MTLDGVRMRPSVRFTIAFCILALLVAGGTVGYSLIEKWSLLDGLYMTVITITTVGFGEVKPLSAAGKHFTIVFLVLSIASVGYSVTTLITYIFEGQIVHVVKERRMNRSIKRLKDHYIVCGYGDVGREVAREFTRAGVKFIIIDRDPEKSELVKDQTLLYVQGDAEDDEILKDASIDRAKGLVSVLPEDELNVFVVLSARQLNPNLLIVSKAIEQRTIRKLMKVGADRVISPNQIAGQRLASIVLRPAVLQFLDVMMDGVDTPMRMEQVEVEAGSWIAEKTLRESGIGSKTGAVIVGINAPDGRTRTNPSSNASISSVLLKEKDLLIAVGNDEQLRRLREFVKRGR
jgi:voltage-gated potassium channel